MSDASPGSHSYYDWQVSTLMLAYDAVEPLSRNDIERQNRRQQKCEREVRDIALAVIPPDFERDPSREIPPPIIVEMTRATLRRASEIVGLIGKPNGQLRQP